MPLPKKEVSLGAKPDSILQFPVARAPQHLIFWDAAMPMVHLRSIWRSSFCFNSLPEPLATRDLSSGLGDQHAARNHPTGGESVQNERILRP